MLEDRAGLVPTTALSDEIAQLQQTVQVVGPPLQGLRQDRLGLVQRPKCAQCQRQVQPGGRVIRLACQSVAVVGERFIETTALVQHRGGGKASRDVVRCQGRGAQEAIEGFALVALLPLEAGKIVNPGSRTGLDRQRFLDQRDPAFDVALRGARQAQKMGRVEMVGVPGQYLPVETLGLARLSRTMQRGRLLEDAIRRLARAFKTFDHRSIRQPAFATRSVPF